MVKSEPLPWQSTEGIVIILHEFPGQVLLRFPGHKLKYLDNILVYFTCMQSANGAIDTKYIWFIGSP